MRPDEIIGRQPKGQRARTGDLEAVVIDGDVDGASADPRLAVAQGVGKRLTEGFWRVEWVVHSLEEIGKDPASHGQVVAKEPLSPHQEVECVADLLTVIEELRPVDAPEPRHPKQALRIP
jgi:hypothetical protein